MKRDFSMSCWCVLTRQHTYFTWSQVASTRRRSSLQVEAITELSQQMKLLTSIFLALSPRNTPFDVSAIWASSFLFFFFLHDDIIFDFANLSRLLDFLETINGVSGVDGSSTWLSPKIISFFLLFFGAVSPRTHYESSQTISSNCSRLSDSTLFFCFLVDEIIFFVVFLENSFLIEKKKIKIIQFFFLCSWLAPVWVSLAVEKEFHIPSSNVLLFFTRHNKCSHDTKKIACW